MGVATASLFPEISIIGSIGSQSQGWGTLPTIGKYISSFGPGAVLPLLDFGALDVQVHIADLTAHASMANYRKTILNAVREVDSSIDGYQAQKARIENWVPP